jgi:hypothetical protein
MAAELRARQLFISNSRRRLVSISAGLANQATERRAERAVGRQRAITIIIMPVVIT